LAVFPSGSDRLKNSQPIRRPPGERHAYFPDRILESFKSQT